MGTEVQFESHYCSLAARKLFWQSKGQKIGEVVGMNCTADAKQASIGLAVDWNWAIGMRYNSGTLSLGSIVLPYTWISYRT